MKRLIELDADLKPRKSTLFEYAGVGAPLGLADHNPGALTRITLPEGGTVAYQYGRDTVIVDRSPEIVAQGRLWSGWGSGKLGSDYEFWSMSGSDFFVVWKGELLQAYRWMPENRYMLDGTFPLSNVVRDNYSGYWVQNDYVISKHADVLEVAKRSGDGWRKCVIDSGVTPSNLEVLGLGSDYFIYATSCSYFEWPLNPNQGNVKIATWSNSGSWTVQSLGTRSVGLGYRLLCGTRFFASTLGWPVFVYNPSTAAWENTGNEMVYSAAGSDCLLSQTGSSSYQIMKWAGSSWSYADVQGPPYPTVPGASLIPGNNFFLIFNGSQLWVVTNTATGWRAISWVDLIPAAIVDMYSKVTVGPDFFAVTWRQASENKWKVGVVQFKNGAWQQGSIVAEYPARPVGQDNCEECRPVVSGSTLFIEIYAGDDKLELHTLAQQNGVWDTQLLVSLELGWWGGYQNSLKPFMQPGANFTVCVIDSNLQRFGDGTLLAWKRAYGANFREVYSDTTAGGYSFPVVSKTVSDGYGHSPTTRFEYSFGAFDDDINTVRYNKSSVILPGSAGRTVTYSYNDLGPGEVEEFRSNPDYHLLDGNPYLVQVFDKDENLKSSTTSDWTVTQPGLVAVNGSLNPNETYDSGSWGSSLGGALHVAIDDGSSVNWNDFVSTQTQGDMFWIRLQAPNGSLMQGSNLEILVDAAPYYDECLFCIVLWQYNGSSFTFIAESRTYIPANTPGQAYTLPVPAEYVDDPTQLYVSIELLIGLMDVARIRCDYQGVIDRGVSYARLTQTTAVRDGVSFVTSQEYNTTNGLVKKVTETNSDGIQRVTETKYAYERGTFAQMGSAEHMLSQPYATTVSRGGTDVEKKKWTLWGNGDGVWRPREEWVWRGDGTLNDETAPVDPEGSSEALKVATYAAYDSHGNVRESSDASGVNTSIVYGYDSSLAIATIRGAPSSSVYASVFDDSVYSGWVSTYGTWTIQNGVFRQSDGAVTSLWNTPTVNNQVQVDDAVVEADVRFEDQTGNRYIAIAKVVSAASYIRFECRKGENLARIHVYAPGSDVSQSQSTTFIPNRWYHLRGEIQGQTARFHIDGKKVVELTSALVDGGAGSIGLSTFATLAEFDNVRIYPLGGQAVSQVFNRRTFLPKGAEDENGVLLTNLHDALGRKRIQLIRSEGQNVMASEIRYRYSRAIGDVFERESPNSVEIITAPEPGGYSDMSSSSGWTVSGTDVTFGFAVAGENAVRLGTDGGSYNFIARPAPSTHTLARIDFYADVSTDGYPHVLAFDGSGYRFCVLYDVTNDRFYMQTYFGGSWLYPLTFDLPAPPGEWYTIELEKTESGEAYAYVFPKGEGRISKTGYCYQTSGYPTAWSPSVISYSNTDYVYLANSYVGLPDRTVSYFDGMGRALQTQEMLKNSDIVVTSTLYDSSGREYRGFKAYEKNFGGTARHRFDSLFVTNADAYYNQLDNPESHTSGYPYSEKKYHPDPLKRMSKTSFPGSVWRMDGGHEVQSAFGQNGFYDIPGFSNGSHYKTVTTDENGVVAWTFTDKFGRTTRTVTDPTGLNLCTQMNYDLGDNLTASITPRGDTSRYSFSPLGLLSERATPDQGTTKNLYDKAGNLRLVKDAAHTGTAPNNVDLHWNTIVAPYSTSGQFTLTMPGKVSVNAYVWDINDVEYLTVRIKANGTTIKNVQTVEFSGGSGSTILPKGTYTYEIQTTGEYGYFGALITCVTGYECIYYKYDTFNRLVEIGEYESSSASANFTQANAENTSFPSSNCLLTTALTYDTESAVDARGSVQRNLKGKLSTAKAYRQGALAQTTAYSYDHFGNTEWTVQTSSAGRWWRQRFEYDVQGRITKKSFLDSTAAGRCLFTFYEYDQMGRLGKVYTSPNADTSGRALEGSYAYFAGGIPKRLQLAQVQGVDYRYNTRDWLTMINHQNLGGVYQGQPQDPGRDGFDSGLPVDRFGLIIGYNDVAHIGSAQSAQAQFGGNISWAMYTMSGVTTQGAPVVGNSYSYDNASRITSANFGYYSGGWQTASHYDEAGYTYDANGNILGLRRNGHTGALMDNLSYVYTAGSNRLRHITDSVSAGAFVTDIDSQSADNYTYDDNGNLQKDVQRDIAFVVNDIRNLPVSMWKSSTGTELKYFYDTEGKRIRKEAAATEYYVNNIFGETEAVVNGDGSGATHNVYGGDNIAQVKRAGTAWSRYYYLKDHLGTVKMTVDSSGSVIGYDDFYPFGMQMEGRCYTSSADARYKFTGKERDVESQYDYFGARYYDARIGRWQQGDPAVRDWPIEKLSVEGLLSLSPYQYVRNAPSSRFDPDGYVDKYGNRVFVGVETKGFGHSFVYVRDKLGNNTVYSYGRYDGGSSIGRSSGGANPIGSGVLLKLTGDQANQYIGERATIEGGASYEITNADGQKISQHYDVQFQSGQPSENRPEEGRVVDTYFLPTKNCVTSTVEALDAGGAGEALKNTRIDPKTGRKSAVPPLTPGELKNTLELRSNKPGSNVAKVFPDQQK